MTDDMRNLDMMVEHHMSRLRVVEVRAHWTAPGGWSPTCLVYRFEVYVSYSRRGQAQNPHWGVDGVLALDGFPDEIAVHRTLGTRGGPMSTLLAILNEKVRHDLEQPAVVKLAHLIAAVEVAHEQAPAVPEPVSGGWKPRRELTDKEIAENVEASRHVWMRRTAG